MECDEVVAPNEAKTENRKKQEPAEAGRAGVKGSLRRQTLPVDQVGVSGRLNDKIILVQELQALRIFPAKILFLFLKVELLDVKRLDGRRACAEAATGEA